MSLYKSMNILRTVAIRSTIWQKIQEPRYIKRWVAPVMKAIKSRRDKIGPDPVEPRSSFLEWNYNAEIFAFGKRLGEEFNEKLLRQALTHRSYVNKQKTETEGASQELLSDNFELIQEGDDFIRSYLKESFSKKHPSKIGNCLVEYLMSEAMLSHVGLHLGLKDIILTAEFPVENKTIADTFRAVVAALKHSSGNERAGTFVNDFLICQLIDKDIHEIWDPKNPYERLKELLGKKGITEIDPRLCNESASNTILANYQVGLYSNKKLLGIGWGESVEIAKETAAIDAIKRLYYAEMEK